MENLISIFVFISIFMITIALLYIYMLKDEEIQKRLNYYLDIENKYKTRKNEEQKAKGISGFLRNSNEYIRTVLKKGVQGKNQNKVKQQLIAAGVTIKPEEYLMYRVCSMVIVGAVFYNIFGYIITFFAGMLIGFFIPKAWLDTKRRKRIQKFNDGLGDMLTTIIGSLKVGHSFSQALKNVADESESPIKEEIETMLNELNYGITMEAALNNLKNRMPSSDLEIMIHAVLIQRQIGGNLSVILEVIVNTIRERKRLARHIRTLTAQGRLSGRIIAVLPLLVGTLFFIINRSYMMSFFTDRYGQLALAFGVCLMVIGFVVMNKITKIEV